MPDENTWLNSCLVTRYKNGEDHIPYHRDNEAFIDPESVIVTVSVGETRTISFRNNCNVEAKQLDLEDSSVLVCTRHSQDFWEHSIEKAEAESQTGVRYSFTFRHISPNFANSTVIIGDSNTKHLKFGTGKGTFGWAMPGKRIEAMHVEDIPEPENIGPYRNIVINTGINNVKLRDRRSNQSLINDFEAKCQHILETYPKSKLHISLLLPTKSKSLNYRVNEFNSMLLDMTHNYRNLYIIDHSILCDREGFLQNEFGTWDIKNECHSITDTLHLGKKGIRIFCRTIKTNVMGAKNRFKDRFRGNYREAAERGHRGGYQSPLP